VGCSANRASYPNNPYRGGQNRPRQNDFRLLEAPAVSALTKSAQTVSRKVHSFGSRELPDCSTTSRGRSFRNANREDKVVGKTIAIPGRSHQN